MRMQQLVVQPVAPVDARIFSLSRLGDFVHYSLNLMPLDCRSGSVAQRHTRGQPN